MLFEIPLRKIDEERRLVIGQAAAEGADKSGESMDYATAKAAFQSWSADFEKSTNGLSKGNLRVMHTKEVAGKINDISFDDDSRAVNIVAHVVSDNAWNLVKSGCFSGFSIGGGYAKRWTDAETGLKKYTPIVREISLVDSPCIPTARFVELIKADGVVEQIELHGVAHSFADLWAERPPSFNDLVKARRLPVPSPAPPLFDDLHKGTMVPFSMRAPGNHFRPQRIIGLSTRGKIAAGVAGAAVVGGAAYGIGKLIQRKLNTPYAGDTGEHVEQPFQHTVNHGLAAALGAVSASATVLGLANSGRSLLRLARHPAGFGSGRAGKIAAVAAAPIGAALGYVSSHREHVENSGQQPGKTLRIAAHVGDGLRAKAPAKIGSVIGSQVAGIATNGNVKAVGRGKLIGGVAGHFSSGADQRALTRHVQRGYRRDVILANGMKTAGTLSEAEHKQRVDAAHARWSKVSTGEVSEHEV